MKIQGTDQEFHQTQQPERSRDIAGLLFWNTLLLPGDEAADEDKTELDTELEWCTLGFEPMTS